VASRPPQPEIAESTPLNAVSLRRQIVAGETAEAHAVILQAIAEGRQDAVVHELLAAIALRVGNAKGAAVHLAEALACDSDWPQAHALGIKIFSSLGQLSTAAEHAQRALALNPNDTTALSAAAKLFTKRGEHAEAADLRLRLARLRPHDPDLRTRAITLMDRAGLHDRAISEAADACICNPSAPELHLQHCKLAVASGDTSAIQRAVEGLLRLDARAALDQVADLVLGGHFRQAAWLMSCAAASGNRLDADIASSLARYVEVQAARAESGSRLIDALAGWRLAEALLPDRSRTEETERVTTKALKAIGELHKRGDMPAAYTMASALAAILPTARTLAPAASLAASAGDHRASAEFYTALTLASDGGDPVDALERALRQVRKDEDQVHALSLLERLRAALPKSTEIAATAESLLTKVHRRARDLVEEGNAAAAHPLWTLLSAWNYNSERLASLARHLVRLDVAAMRDARRDGELSTAAEAAKRLLSIDPGRIDALKFLGGQQLKDARYEAAAITFAQLRQLEPDVSKHLYQLGRAYRSLRRYEEGIAALMEFLQDQPDDEAGRDLLNEMVYRHAR